MPRFDFSRFLNIRIAAAPTPSPDGGRIAFLYDITGVPQVWSAPSEGGWPDQLTFFTEPVGSARFEPQEGRYFVFSRDVGGNEFAQLYRQDLADGRVTPDTPRRR